MPSKKRKYNARFPAGRIKKIMQTDEEVGKVAQAVPVIICGPTPRTLELFVESLLRKSMDVTTARNAKTLSPSHVKQCILAESRFDFLKDLVKNIPDVSAADEKEDMSSENSPNSSRFVDMPPPNTQSSAPHTMTAPSTSALQCTRQLFTPDGSTNSSKQSSSAEPSASFGVPSTKRPAETSKATGYAKHLKEDSPKGNLYDVSQSVPMNLTVQNTSRRVPNFYQETLVDEPTEQSDTSHSSVIQVNPKYTGHTNHSAATSTNRTMLGNIMPKIELSQSNHLNTLLNTSQTNAFNIRSMETVGSQSPLINIDFTKNFSQPEIKFVRTGSSTPNIMMENINKHNTLTKQMSAPIITAKVDGIASSNIVRNSQKSYTSDLDKHNLDLDEDYDT